MIKALEANRLSEDKFSAEVREFMKINHNLP